MSKNLLKDNGLENNNIDKYVDMITERLTKHEFLNGAEISIHDLSLYGITYTFSVKPTMKCFQDMLDKSEKFSQWFIKMCTLVGPIL
jgi:glutathione S-transferase